MLNHLEQVAEVGLLLRLAGLEILHRLLILLLLRVGLIKHDI